MSEKNRQQKEPIERATLDYFLKAYNELKGTHLQFVNKQERPDFLVRDRDSVEDVGVEVTVLFYDDEEAKMLLGRSNKADSLTLHGFMNSRALITRLNITLENKAKAAQKYNFEGNLILVIRTASRVFDKESFDMHETNITIPANRFNEIWLVFCDSSNQECCDLKCLEP